MMTVIQANYPVTKGLKMPVKLLTQALIMTAIQTAVSGKSYLEVTDVTCGREVNIDSTEETHLHMQYGDKNILNKCSIYFLSDDFTHDTCFRLTSPLDCHVTIQFHSHGTADRTLLCNDTDAQDEFCNTYSSMSVVFSIEQSFYLTKDVVIDVYIKHDDAFSRDAPVTFLSYSSIFPVIVGTVGTLILVILVPFIKYKCKQRATSQNTEIPEGLSVHFNHQPSPSTSERSFDNEEPYNLKTTGSETRYHTGEYASGNQHQRRQEPPRWNQPAVDFRQPPPPYEDAQYYSSPYTEDSQDIDVDQIYEPEIDPREHTPDVPPPPYPGV